MRGLALLAFGTYQEIQEGTWMLTVLFHGHANSARTKDSVAVLFRRLVQTRIDVWCCDISF